MELFRVQVLVQSMTMSFYWNKMWKRTCINALMHEPVSRWSTIYIHFFDSMMYSTPVVVEEVVLVVEGRFPQKVWSFEACRCCYCYWCQLTLILQIRRHKKFNSVIHPTELDQQNMRKYIEICSNPKSENLLNVCQILHVFVRVSDNTIVHSAARLEKCDSKWAQMPVVEKAFEGVRLNPPKTTYVLTCVFSTSPPTEKNTDIGLLSICLVCSFVGKSF